MPAAEPPHVAGGRGEAATGSDALPSRAELGWVPVASPRFPKPGTHTRLFSAQGCLGEAERTQPGFGWQEPSEHRQRRDA